MLLASARIWPSRYFETLSRVTPHPTAPLRAAGITPTARRTSPDQCPHAQADLLGKNTVRSSRASPFVSSWSEVPNCSYTLIASGHAFARRKPRHSPSDKNSWSELSYSDKELHLCWTDRGSPPSKAPEPSQFRMLGYNSRFTFQQSKSHPRTLPEPRPAGPNPLRLNTLTIPPGPNDADSSTLELTRGAICERNWVNPCALFSHAIPMHMGRTTGRETPGPALRCCGNPDHPANRCLCCSYAMQ